MGDGVELVWRSQRLARFVEVVSWSSRGDRLVVAADDTVVIYELVGREELREVMNVSCGSGHIYATAWSSDGRYLAIASSNSKLVVLDVEKGSVVYRDEVPPGIAIAVD